MQEKYKKGVEPIASALLMKDGKILMARAPKWSDKWTLPGGHIESGESIIDAAKREVKEETNLQVKPVEIIAYGELIDSKDFHRPAHFIYFDILFNVTGEKLELQDEELSEHGWFTVDEALELDLAESFDDTLLKLKKYLEQK